MSWEPEGPLEEYGEPSQISVSSRIYVNKKEKQRSGTAAGRSLEPQQSLDKCLASTNVQSELPQLPSLEKPGDLPRTRRTMVDDFKPECNQPSNYNTTVEPSSEGLRDAIQTLMEQLTQLEHNEMRLQQNFFGTISALKQDLNKRTERNRQMRNNTEQLRRELLDRRSEVRQLILSIKSQQRHNHYEQPQQVEPYFSPGPRLDTLKQLQSERHLNSQERNTLRQSMSGEQRKFRLINGRRVYIRQKSETGKQWRL